MTAKRYFTTSWGIDYTIVARDRAHAFEILRQAAADDFKETFRMEGEPFFAEMTEDEAEVSMVWDEKQDHRSQVPLTTLELGAWASTEF